MRCTGKLVHRLWRGVSVSSVVFSAEILMHMYLQTKSQFVVDYVPYTTKILPFQPPEAEEVWTSLRMSIDLVNVSLELLPIQLFEHPDENADYAQLPSLARIDFIKSKFEFESFSDWSKTIDLVSEEVIFEDTRQKGTFYLYICLLAIFRYCLGFFIDLVKSKVIFFCNSFLCH